MIAPRKASLSVRARSALVGVAFLGACAPPPDSRVDGVDSALDQVRAELLEMYAIDQSVREGFGAAAAANDTLYAKRMLRLDSVHTSRLVTIIEEHGWPGRTKVGDDAAHAAWMLVQHSPDYRFQKEALELLGRPDHVGDVAPGEIAMLTDRVRGNEGLPQIYGTQFEIVDGALVLPPIEDDANVDARRAMVGLPPMADYMVQVEAMTGLKLRR